MSLINQDIKNLVSGISQQPPILRHPEQLEEQINGFSSEAAGLQKRPPTIFINKLHKHTPGNKPLIHFINRDAYEQYAVIFDGTDIVVYDLQGRKYTVNYEGNAKSYIQLVSPRMSLRCVTIADYTFILNKTKTVTMSSAVTTNYWASQGALVNIKSGQYGRTYRIDVNGATIASYTTPDGSDKSHVSSITTDNIANQLATAARNNGWTVTVGSSWLYIYGKAISTLAVYDGYNNQAAFGIFKTTQKFTNLPISAPNGFVVKIAGEKGSTTDDYYVRFNTSSGVWEETVRPGITYTYNKSTLPHVLVREANGTFTFREGEWADREIGDDDSNPIPTFVDQTINDVFYYRNRLGFLSGENIIFSRSADFFNFWMTSAIEVQDTDPIDLAASDNSITTLYSAVPFDAELIIFGEDAQFSMKTDSILSPKDAYLTPPLTHFGSSLKARPVNAGRNIYFTAERAKYTTMREYFTAADNTESKDAQDITAHVPSFIPNGVYKIIPSTIENILLCLTEGDEKSIYVYKYLFIDGQRQQAAWSKWEYDDIIYGGAFIDSFLYLVIERNGYLCLEKMSFTFNTIDLEGEPYSVLLDSKVAYTVPTSAYDSYHDETKIDVSVIYGDVYESGKQYSIVVEDGTYVNADANGIVTLAGNYSGKQIFVGLNYLFKITLSTILVKMDKSGSITSMNEGRLQLRQCWFNYSNSGYFKVIVKMMDKDQYVYENTSRVLGTANNTFGKMPFTTGSFKFPVQSLNTNCVISLETDAPLPVSLIGAGWVGNYIRRSRLF